MQILLLGTKEYDHDLYGRLSHYQKSKSQNILYARYDDVYRSNGFVYARTCHSVKVAYQHQGVLLSPSLVIDVTNGASQNDLEQLFSAGWSNTQQAFYRGKGGNLYRQKNDDSFATCLCFTTNNALPMFSVIKGSVNTRDALCSEGCLGLIEQAITEHFADINYFGVLWGNANHRFSSQQSMLFFVSFEISRKYGDYQVEIMGFEVLDVGQLLSHGEHFAFDYFDELIQYRLNHYVQQVKFRTHIIKLCEETGIDLEPSLHNTFVLSKDEHVGVHSAYFGSVNSKDGIAVILDKHQTNIYLSKHGFCVNRSVEYSIKDLQDKTVIQRIPLNYPLVLKPTDSKAGYGVVTNIPNQRRMLISAQKIGGLEGIDKVLVEEFFEGVTYRVLVVCGKVVAVLKFIPANILGDGETQIDDLIRAKNLITKSRIRINNALRLSIFNDGKRWETVLPVGEQYVLSYNSHASTGGQSINVTEVFRVQYKLIAEQACRSLGIRNAGLDMIVNAEGDYRIIEVNSGPALATHRSPKYGDSIDAYSLVLDCLLKQTDLNRDDNQYLDEMMVYHQ